MNTPTETSPTTNFSSAASSSTAAAEPIKFYRVSQEYGFFSNFSAHPILLKCKHWPTSEHYFQAQKFAGSEFEEKVRLAASAKEAAAIGRDRSLPLRKDWEEVKDNIMFEAVMAKFRQHDDLRAALLATGSALLIEHTEKDSYWADGGDGSGKNMLGIILMRVRSILSSQ